VSLLYSDKTNFSQDIITNTQLDHDSKRIGFEQRSSCWDKRTNKCEVLFITLSLKTNNTKKCNHVNGDEDNSSNDKNSHILITLLFH